MKYTPSEETLEAILCVAASLTLAEAVELLANLDRNFLIRVIYKDKYDARALIFQALEKTENLTDLCTFIGPIWFHGGPPGQREWVCGMVSQYVADCLLISYIDYGEPFVAGVVDSVIRLGAP